MIRDKTKIYGETNHPDTALLDNQLTPNKYVISTGGNKPKLSTIDPRGKSILFVNAQGEASTLPLNTPNGFVGTDDTGKLEVFVKPSLPDAAPVGRELVAEVFGSTTPAGSNGFIQLELTAPYWYEIEVIGAGGGGGAGALSEVSLYNHSKLDGSNGGFGGYHKMVFPVATPILATLEAGCSGGGGGGHTVYNNNYNYVVSSDSYGGDGGRSPIKYSEVGNQGDNAVWLESKNRLGGAGINSGANGGSVLGGYELEPAPGIAGSAGGGAVGAYGGDGGICYSLYDINNNPDLHNSGPGSGGGAGGGLGKGGNGGSTKTQEGETQFTRAGGIGYGGGGGGRGSVGMTPSFKHYQYSAGAGGGGGASRFVCGDLEVICGGGGGGAGVGGTAGQGSPGRNNKNIAKGGGAGPGIGGKALGIPDIPSGRTLNTNGTNGSRGVVRIWRCKS